MTRGGIEPTTIGLKARYRIPFDYLAILGVALPPLLAEAHPIQFLILYNSLLYEAVAAPCTSLVQSSAGTTVKVVLTIPAAPHTTSHLIPRLPYI